MSVGNLVKKKRKELKMTQQELAEGICTQALISKLERNELNPSAEIINKISKRLNVPLFIFYNEELSGERNSLDLKEIIRKHLARREYKDITYLVNQYQTLINNTTNSEDVIFFQWIKAILLYYIERDTKQSLSLLKELEQSLNYDEFSIEVLSSIATIHLEERNFYQALDTFDDFSSRLDTIDKFDLKAKILFNHSLCLLELEKMDKALQIVMQGIEICRIHNSMYLLGDFLYHKAILLTEFEEWNEAKLALNASILIFQLQNNNIFEMKARIYMKKIEDKTK